MYPPHRPPAARPKTTRRAWVLGALLVAPALPVAAHPLEFTGAQIALASSPTTTADCFFFTLVGITPDPGQPWFAVARSHLGFREIVALVTSAKLSQQVVTVRTTIATACGYRGVEYVFLQ